MFTCRNCDANPIIVTRKENNQHSGVIPLSPQPSFSIMARKDQFEMAIFHIVKMANFPFLKKLKIPRAPNLTKKFSFRMSTFCLAYVFP